MSLMLLNHLYVFCHHFIQSSVAVLRQCGLLEFYPNRSLWMISYTCILPMPQPSMVFNHYLLRQVNLLHVFSYFKKGCQKKCTQSTIPKGFVGGFEFSILERNSKELHKRPWTYVYECQRKATKVGLLQLIFYLSNFYFYFVSTSLVYIIRPKNKRKTKITGDKRN